MSPLEIKQAEPHACLICSQPITYSDKICENCWPILISIVDSHICQNIPELNCTLDPKRQYQCNSCMIQNIETFVKLTKLQKLP